MTDIATLTPTDLAFIEDAILTDFNDLRAGYEEADEDLLILAIAKDHNVPVDFAEFIICASGLNYPTA